MTFIEYYKNWVETYKEGAVREVTLKNIIVQQETWKR